MSWNYSPAWADQASTGYGCASGGSVGVAVDPVAPDAPAATRRPPTSRRPTRPSPTRPSTSLPPTDDSCAEPEPPAGIPTAAEAEASARELMASLGLDPAAFTFDVYADEWSASVSATEQVDGLPTGRNVSFGYGAEGALQWAGGQLNEPSAVGPYELVDLDAALARLNDPSGFYGGFGGPAVMERGVAVDSVGAVEAVDPPDSTIDDSTPVEQTIDGTVVPGEDSMGDMPEPEAVTVTLTDVKADLWWAWDADGSVWLLPAYTFTGDDGGTYTVPAVTDEFLIQPPVDTTLVDPTGRRARARADAARDGARCRRARSRHDWCRSRPCPIRSRCDTAFDTTQLDSAIGTSLAEFTKLAESLGASVRVSVIDGVDQAVDDGLQPDPGERQRHRRRRPRRHRGRDRRHRLTATPPHLAPMVRAITRSNREIAHTIRAWRCGREAGWRVAWAVACSTISPTASTGSSSASAARDASPRPTSTR